MVFGSRENDERQQQQQQESPPKQWFTLSIRHDNDDDDTSSSSSQSQNSTVAVRNSFVAGLIAGVTGTLVGHPLDSVKVWIQTGQQRPTFENATTSKMGGGTGGVGGILSALRRSYAGVASPVLTVGLIQSINFAAYDSMRRYWYYTYEVDTKGNPSDKAYLNNDSFTSIAVSGVAAGAVVSTITQPVMMIKTKQQTQQHNMKFAQAIKHSIRYPMIGFGTHFFMETANRSIYFVVYEAIKRKYADDDEHGNASMSVRMMGAMAAGVSCWMFIYPSDVIRSRLYSASASGRNMNALQVVREMYAQQGVRSFFKGYGITMLRAGPVAAFILPVYDVVLDFLNKMSS